MILAFPISLRALEADSYHLRLTRDLDTGKAYLRQRYADAPDQRYGLIASSRDTALASFGVPNDWNATKSVNKGAWFGEGDADPLGRSCRALRTCVTEFGCQGLELDATLLAWGTDLIVEDGRWSNRLAKRYQRPSQIHDALQLRINAYRVLLTRARDATVVFVPPIPILDETSSALLAAGFVDLDFGRGSVTGETLSLDDAVMGAAEAPPSIRIEYRDQIARYGSDGIDRVTPWLGDPALAAFAVRVIARAADFGAAERSRQVLQTSLATLQGPPRADALSALEKLGGPLSRPRTRKGGPPDPPAMSLSELAEGRVYRRRELHSAGLGGNQQKGISYPANGTYVMLFSTPEFEQAWGYNDSWLGQDAYRYYGEWSGTGDMLPIGGNRAIVERSPEIYLFVKVSTGHRYAGKFTLVAEDPRTDRPRRARVLGNRLST